MLMGWLEINQAAGIGGVLHNRDGVLAMSSKSMGCMESNEAEVVAILEALRRFFPSFHSKPVVESYSSNAISWVSFKVSPPWRLQFYFNEIKTLSTLVIVEFHHVGRSANSFAYSLAKQGVDTAIPLVGFPS